MTRKRLHRKMRLEHGSYVTFDLWKSIVTVSVTLIITGSCAATISHKNTTYFTNSKSSQIEQNVTNIPESHENYANNYNITEIVDRMQGDINTYEVNTKDNNPHNISISNVTKNVTAVELNTTSHDLVTIKLNMNDKSNADIDGSNYYYEYDFTTDSHKDITPIINEAINSNEELLGNMYAYENTTLNEREKQNITKDDAIKNVERVNGNDKKEEDSIVNTTIADSVVEESQWSAATNEQNVLNVDIKSARSAISGDIVDVTVRYGDTIKPETNLHAIPNELNGTRYGKIYYNSDTVYEENTEYISLYSQQTRLRSGKRLREKINKKNYETESRLHENNVIKHNSEKSDNSLSLNVSDTNTSDTGTRCTNCGVGKFTTKIKSDSFTNGSKSDIKYDYDGNKKKVNSLILDDNVKENNITNVQNTSVSGTVNSDYVINNKNKKEQPNKILKYMKNYSMTETLKDEGAFYLIRVLAQGVLESVAERVIPSGLLDIFRRMQNQSTALETERLRSKKENGGLGDWGRSVIRSVISDPFNQLMQGVRDNGSLDTNKNFFSGVASGVAYVADSVADSFKDRVKAIFPGTLWCGDGDVARSDELGLFYLTDLCCKNHDTCKYYISAGGTKFGLTNTGLFSRSHCNCDRAFYRCLKKTNSIVSTQIGVTFFSILGPQCFKKDYPIVRCVRRTRITGQKCEEYELDETQPKIWQWFDSPTF